MDNAPILILQMQRMGDLVLSFPLLAWLAQLYPNNPLWVVGEPSFYEPLMPLSPNATYFPYESAKGFAGMEFHTVINVSHRPEAATIASSVKSQELFGFYHNNNGSLKVRGDWQLYKASLTQNNKFNLFHWTDLDALDFLPAALRINTVWPQAKQSFPVDNSARIGLFLGASEPQKCPDASFWISLTRRLYALGFKPVLLGGKAEIPLGKAVADKLSTQAINMCGTFSVEQLAYFIRELDLLVTPDTGPMHVASWTGTTILNLSLGPVNPWETGPFASANYVYRPLVECSGCWECSQSTVLCKEAVKPAHVAKVIQGLLDKAPIISAKSDNSVLFTTKRDHHGLFMMNILGDQSPLHDFPQKKDQLSPVQKEVYLAFHYGHAFALHYTISQFWKYWFASAFGDLEKNTVQEVWGLMLELFPEFSQSFLKAAVKLSMSLSHVIQGKKSLDSKSLWSDSPSFFRPLSGFCHMYLQNENNSRAAMTRALTMVEEIALL